MHTTNEQSGVLVFFDVTKKRSNYSRVCPPSVEESVTYKTANQKKGILFWMTHWRLVTKALERRCKITFRWFLVLMLVFIMYVDQLTPNGSTPQQMKHKKDVKYGSFHLSNVVPLIHHQSFPTMLRFYHSHHLGLLIKAALNTYQSSTSSNTICFEKA